MATLRVGVDIGGTFTDIVVLSSDGAIHTKKVSSTSASITRAMSRERSIRPMPNAPSTRCSLRTSRRSRSVSSIRSPIRPMN
jgi:N-methylhydantoinase A/oxoprolinase/acetone carboxylase beta subunit